MYFLELIKAGTQLTDQKRGWQHFGVIGAFPAAILEMRGQSKEVILWRKGSKFNMRPLKVALTLVKKVHL